MALDPTHQQIFTAWTQLDRIDVLSTADHHLIHSITVPSPTTIDISPDGTTLAVGTGGAHIFFYSTATFAKVNDIVWPDSALGISGFLYTANGNAMIRAEAGLSTGGGITVYWDHATNSFQNASYAGEISSTAFSATGPMARSGDYSKIMLGDATSGGEVQIVDGDTGQIVWTTGTFGFNGYIYSLAANNDASRYAVCVQVPGAEQDLVVLDATFDEIYQDDLHSCLGLAFSSDGSKLYHDVGTNSGTKTEVLDMASFTATHAPNFYTSVSNWTGYYPTSWQVADATGMVYGVNSNLSQGFGAVAWIALDTNSSAGLEIPTTSDSVKIIHVVDNIGSPQGGDEIRLICTGVGQSASGISVTIGGLPVTNVAVYGGLQVPNGRLVTVKTPPGSPGEADVTVSTNEGSDTAHGAFQYANSRNIFPFATSPNFLLYDPQRNRLYASHKDQVEVIDIASQAVLTPLIPASGKLTNSQFSGLSLSPDGNRLYIADTGAGVIHMLDLTNPGQGVSIDVGRALGNSSAVPPTRVFELSTGQLLGSTGSQPGVSYGAGSLFQIDPATQTGEWARDPYGGQIGAFLWNSTNQGRNVLMSKDGDGLISSFAGLWNADSSSNFAPSAETQWIEEASANEDGTVIAAGGSTPGFADINPEIVDFSLHPVGSIDQHFDVYMPTGTPSFFLHPSGALLYKAGTNTIGGPGFPGSTVEIDDMHALRPAASVAFPEAFATSYTPPTDHMLASDPTGKYLFGVTQSGITMMTLNTVPLSIGNVQPVFIQPEAGQTVTVRGSGFQPGATVSIGGIQTDTTYVDPDTLTAQTPALTAGWQDVMVALPDGASYTAPALLQVLGSQPTPVVTGFSPASIVVQTGIPGFDQPSTVTVQGSNFAIYDTVEINGQAVASVFLDSSDMQATIPAQLTGTAGSIAVAVVSPYTGSSNTLALPMVNPVPVPEDNRPISFQAGETLNLNLYGTGFVPGSIIQWNGQNLSTYLNGGETTSGLEMVSATASGALTQLTGNATVTVYNPPPGGGVSAPITATLGYQPVPLYSLFGANNSLLGSYYSIPPPIDFGTQVVGFSETFNLSIQSAGSVGYSVSSIAVSGAGFSTTASTCPTLSGTVTCIVPITLQPTATGAANGTLTIADNLPGSPHSIPLTGNGIQTPLPVVAITTINALTQTVSARVQGTAVVGGASIPATAWIEYGTDQALSTYSKSSSWTLTGDGILSGNLSNLSAGTLYAARLAVQTGGGIGRSSIHLFYTAAAPAWVAISLAPGASNSATITAGKTATYSLIASDGGNGYIGTADFSCSGAPAGATCSVSPSQVAVGTSPSPFTVTVTTTAVQSADRRNRGGGASGWALGFTFAFGMLATRKPLRPLCLVLASAAMLGLTCISCGGGSGSGGAGGSGGGGTTPATATPPGTYYLTVTGTTGGAQNSYLLDLTVQ